VTPTEPVPVVVAGGGVTGTTLALLLAQRGVRVLVLEAHLQPNRLPRAHAVNPRTLEIMRELGLYDQIRSSAAPSELTNQVRFVSTLTGHCFGVLPYERQDDGVAAFTPTPLLNIPQPTMEEIVFARASQHPLIEVRRGHVWQSAQSVREGTVTSYVQAGTTDYPVESRFLVGADGANSSVREQFGIELTGNNNIASAVSITFQADLAEVLRRRPGVLHWVFGAVESGVLLAYYPDRLWAFSVPLPPGGAQPGRYSDEHAYGLVRSALGPGASNAAVEILEVSEWTMRCEVADRFRVGNVFLAGDAAHRFPPTGGLGLNTSIQDAHNLAWKLAAVLEGWSPAALLDTYGDERRPVAIRNAEQSRLNMAAMAQVGFLEELSTLVGDPVRFDASMGEPGRTEQIAAAIDAQRDHFDSLALQLGFTYDTDAPAIVDVARLDARARRGGRLPHGWLTLDGRTLSTLDLVSTAGFTVISVRADGATPVIGPGGVPLRTIRLDPSDSGVAQWMSRAAISNDSDLAVRPDGHIVDIAHGDPASTAARIERSIGALIGAATRLDDDSGLASSR
jgi:2,4-dichlorophenol 6-monooxygenase